MASTREVIGGPGVPRPLGHYSPGIRHGDTLYVAGQAGIDPATGAAAGEDFDAQARQALRNLEAVLRAGGSAPEHVLNVTVSCAEMGDFAALNALFAEVWPVDPPARMTSQVPLPLGLLISIGCVAAVPA